MCGQGQAVWCCRLFILRLQGTAHTSVILLCPWHPGHHIACQKSIAGDCCIVRCNHYTQSLLVLHDLSPEEGSTRSCPDHAGRFHGTPLTSLYPVKARLRQPQPAFADQGTSLACMPYFLVGLLVLPVGLPLKAYKLHLKVDSSPLWQVRRPVWAPIICIPAAMFRSHREKGTRASRRGPRRHCFVLPAVGHRWGTRPHCCNRAAHKGLLLAIAHAACCQLSNRLCEWW